MWSQPSAKNSRPYDGRSECCRNDTCSPICPIGGEVLPRLHVEPAARGQPRHAVSAHARAAAGAGRPLVAHRARRRGAARPATGARGSGARRSSSARSSSSSPAATCGARTCCCSRRPAASRTASPTARAPWASTSRGHRNQQAFIALPHAPVSRHERAAFARDQAVHARAASATGTCGTTSACGSQPSRASPACATTQGAPLLGDDILRDWRERTRTGRGPRAGVLRRDPRPIERAHARRLASQRVGRSAAEARVPRRAGVRRAARVLQRHHPLALRGDGEGRRRHGARRRGRRRRLAGPSRGRMPDGRRSGDVGGGRLGPHARPREPVRRGRPDLRERAAARTPRSPSARWRCAPRRRSRAEASSRRARAARRDDPSRMVRARSAPARRPLSVRRARTRPARSCRRRRWRSRRTACRRRCDT